MEIHKIYEKVLDIYLEHRKSNPEFTFATRMTKDKRLKAGYWFQGTDEYIFSPPFAAGDANNKTKTIGFVLNMKNGEVTNHYIEIVFGAPDNLELLDFYKSVLQLTGIEYEEGRIKYTRKLDGDWEISLRRFLAEDVVNISKLISEHELDEKFFISEQAFEKYYQNILDAKDNGLIALDASEDTEESEELKKSVHSKILSPQNIIMYGPPGTGKTYNTKQRAVELIMGISFADSSRNEIAELYDEFVKNGQLVFTTFHQSLGYEDFIEGIKPVVTDGTDEISYKIEEGIFKSLADKATRNFKKSNLDEAAFSKEDYIDRLLVEFTDWVEEGLLSSPLKLTESVDIIATDEHCFRYRGTTWQGSEQGLRIPYSKLKYMFENDVQTRQELKKLPDIGGGGRQHASYFLKTYHLLKEFEKKQFKNKSKNKENLKERLNQYVIIIDEINRGNISSIFGELITLVEQDKRIGQPEQLKVTLPYSKEAFGVPSNLHIIGTMNTADRSIEALDTALRRRFIFEEKMPDQSLVKNEPYLQIAMLWLENEVINWNDEDYLSKEAELLKWLNIRDINNYHKTKENVWREFTENEKLTSFSDSPQYLKLIEDFFGSKNWKFDPIRLDSILSSINSRLTCLLDRDHTIGHSFFMNVHSLLDLRKVFTNQIIPQLKEYFYGDWNKIGMVLGSAFVKVNNSIAQWPRGFQNDDDFEDSVSLTISSKWSIKDFQSIYDDSSLDLKQD